MNIYDLPVRVERALYDDAMHEYAAKVAGRADAVYATGNINYPGLSDLDLLVVTSSKRADNPQYFSAMHRLPHVYGPILLHDPLVVPAQHKQVLRYTTHRNIRLIAGRDVLRGVAFLDTPEERWCRLLESYCTYAAFVASVESTQTCRGRRLIAKTSSLRFSLREMDALHGTQYAEPYGRRLDELRFTYYFRDPVETLGEAWKIFRDAYQTLTAWLESELGLCPGEKVDDFARRFFSGNARFDVVSAGYVQQRSAEIDAYHEGLARLQIPFGQMFFWEAHGVRGRMFRQRRLQNTVYRIKYKIERMLSPAHAS